jgi:uncharacterized membrane protein
VRSLLRLGPFLLLAGVAAWLAASFSHLPERYPVHWGPGGADRWVDLSIRSVGVPLAMGLVGVGWMGILGRFVLANASPLPEPARARRLTMAMTIGLQWFLALLFGAAAIPRQDPGLVAGAAGLGLLFLPAALVATYAGRSSSPAAPAAPPPDGWLFVPRRNGNGLGFAPGHPRRWQAIAIVAAGPALIVLVGLLA